MWASCISWQKSLRLMKSFGHLKVSCHGHYARFTNGYLIVRLAKTAETLQVKCTQNLCSQQNLQKAKNRKDWKKYCRHVTAAVSTIFCESCLAARGSFAKTGCLVSTSLVQHERIFGRKLMVGCDGRCDGIGKTAPTEVQTKMCKHSFATICSYDTYIICIYTYVSSILIYVFRFRAAKHTT